MSRRRVFSENPSNDAKLTNEKDEIMKLKDKVSIVTGAGGGLGKAIAEVFIKEGAKVIVAARQPSSSATYPSRTRSRT